MRAQQHESATVWMIMICGDAGGITAAFNYPGTGKGEGEGANVAVPDARHVMSTAIQPGEVARRNVRPDAARSGGSLRAAAAGAWIVTIWDRRGVAARARRSRRGQPSLVSGG